MLRKPTFLLAVLLGTAAALADEPSTDATASSTSEKAAATDVAKEPAKKRTARAAGTEDKGASTAAASAVAPPGGDVKMSGMSILGNEDAPKSLVLVPWKSSKLGDMPSVSRLLDSSKQPVDKEVFLRELSYYEFRAGTK